MTDSTSELQPIPVTESQQSVHPHYRRSHLLQLEAEAVYVMREVAAQFERPVLLFSGGKDSITMAYLARTRLLAR